jgi:MFS family permease
MGLIVVGLILLVFLSPTTAYSYLIFSLIVVGCGFGFFTSPNTNAIMGSVDKRYLGIASAMTGTMRLVGQMMSMAVAAMIIHVFLGEAKITITNTHQLMAASRVIFIIFTVLCILGTFASLARGNSIGQVKAVE